MGHVTSIVHLQPQDLLLEVNATLDGLVSTPFQYRVLEIEVREHLHMLDRILHLRRNDLHHAHLWHGSMANPIKLNQPWAQPS